ncbi:MAG: phosphatase PAP2 family protein [Actinomycetota bacterium]|nr:phosphatase PAP2 family protein [Actinomycetota bacterium]
MAQHSHEPLSTDTAEAQGARTGALARARHRLSLQSLHRHPPLTPAAVLLRFRFTVPLLLGAFVFLALAAAVSDAALLRVWDEPVQRAVENARTPWLDTLVMAISQLGGTTIAVVGLLVLLSVVLAQCRSLALALFLATAARPLLEWALKRIIDRPRPDLDRLVHGEGPSFPSGHPLAAMALWGLLPPVVALFTRKRVLWWWSVVVSVTVIVLVAMSRVYLGVHWLSDIVAALLLGSLYLLAVEWILDWHHERRTCRAFVAGGHDLDEDLVRKLTRPPRNPRGHPGE